MSLDDLADSITGKQGPDDATFNDGEESASSPSEVDEPNNYKILDDDEVNEDDDDAASNSVINSVDEDGEEHEEEEDSAFPTGTYHPTEGEDIYGRVIGSSTQKYTPPARRKELVSAIDEVAYSPRRTINWKLL